MRITKKIIITAVTVLVSAVIGYLGITFYFSNRFLPNHWFNNIYCTGMQCDEVNRLLVENTVLPEKIIIRGISDVETEEMAEEVYQTSQFDLSVDYKKAVETNMQSQTPWNWIFSLNEEKRYELAPAYDFSEERLLECLADSKLYTQSDYPADVTISYQGDTYGYHLYNGLNNRLDAEKAKMLISEALKDGSNYVDLCDASCYTDLEPDSTQKDTLNLWTKINKFLGSGPEYDFQEEKLVFDECVMASFLQKNSKGMPLFDENGLFLLDEQKIILYLNKQLSLFDTYEKEWDFQSTSGKTVKVQGVTYGGIIDKEAEEEWLLDYLERVRNGEQINAADRVRIPEYKKKPYYRGKKSVGPTYIEVDMGAQHLYYYDDGQLSLDTDIVTGNKKLKRDTPEGVNFVYGKTKNRVLRGPGYATFVKYWMPVKGAIGIHDATWRDEFGGEIYLTNGSHGCVNVPVEQAGELYDKVEIGTPVVMFY